MENQLTQTIRHKKGLTGNGIKWIALVAMLIDHVGHTIVWKLYLDACMVDGVHMMGDLIPDKAKTLYMVYLITRIIGRIVFPIFAFMLVEGFLHTSNLKKYAGRLLTFALISEIPFDLALHQTMFDITSQNVMWTLLIGLIMLYGIRSVEKQVAAKRIFLTIAFVMVSMAASFLLRTDGGAGGILMIAVIHIFIDKPLYQLIGIIISFIIVALGFMWIELFGLVAFVLLYFFNGKRGKGNKYIFYIFYPLHLLILGLIGLFIL